MDHLASVASACGHACLHLPSSGPNDSEEDSKILPTTATSIFSSMNNNAMYLYGSLSDKVYLLDTPVIFANLELKTASRAAQRVCVHPRSF